MTAFILALALATSDGPVVIDVPRNGAAPSTSQRVSLFHAAQFEVRGGRIRRGAWRSSDEILGEGYTQVVVVATWCPACRNLLARYIAQPPRDTVILFLETERERRPQRAGRASDADRPLADPEILDGYPLPVYLLRAGSALERQVNQYPFHLSCSRTRCAPERARR